MRCFNRDNWFGIINASAILTFLSNSPMYTNETRSTGFSIRSVIFCLLIKKNESSGCKYKHSLWMLNVYNQNENVTLASPFLFFQ